MGVSLLPKNPSFCFPLKKKMGLAQGREISSSRMDHRHWAS